MNSDERNEGDIENDLNNSNIDQEEDEDDIQIVRQLDSFQSKSNPQEKEISRRPFGLRKQPIKKHKMDREKDKDSSAYCLDK